MSTSHQPVLGPGFPLSRVTRTGPRPRQRHKVAPVRGRLRSGVTSTVVGLCVTATVGLAGALAVVPAVAGGHTLTVLSGSMEPAIGVGSVVVVLPVDARDVSVGEIVTYASTDPVTGNDTLVTHRVTGIERIDGQPVFTTGGDANAVADARPVAAEQLRGRVWYHLPWVGTVRDAVFTKTGAMYAVSGVLLIIGLRLLYAVGRSASAETPARERRRARG